MADNGGLIVLVGLLLIFGGLITLSDESSSVSVPQCSDSVDNDGDGNNDSEDGNCMWATDATPPTVPTFYYCPNHNDESSSPTFSTEQEALNAGCEQI